MAAGDDKCLCPSCQKVVSDRHNAVSCCGKCKKWWHIACATISKSQYDHYKHIADKMPGLKWFCSDCEVVVSEKKKIESGKDQFNSNLGVVPPTDDMENDPAIMNILVTEISEMSKNYLALSKRLLELGDENKSIKLTLNELSEQFALQKSKSYSSTTQPTRGSRSGTDSSSNLSNHPNEFLSQTATVDDELNGNKVIKNTPTSPHTYANVVINHSTGASSGSNLKTTGKRALQCVTNRQLPMVNDVSNTSKVTNRPSETENHPPNTESGENTNGNWQTETSRRSKTLQRDRPNVHQNGNKVHTPVSRDRLNTNHPGKSKSHKTKNPIIIGRAGKSPNDSGLGLVGAKRAWFHLGKLAKETKEDDVSCFVKNTFPEASFVVEKLENKGENVSFKLGVDFIHKDLVMNSDKWPQNTTLKRFLFWRTQKPTPP